MFYIVVKYFSPLYQFLLFLPNNLLYRIVKGEGGEKKNSNTPESNF